jgi:hypothetical protein
MEKLLTAHPEHAEQLGHTGSEALTIYLDFLGDCVERGQELAARARGARPATGESAVSVGPTP